MKAILSLQFMIFIMVFLGFLLMKLELVSPEGRKSITNIVLYVTVPCSIVNSFLSGMTSKVLKDCIEIFVIACAVELGTFLYGKWRYRTYPQGEKENLRFGMLISNASFMGIPLAQGVFGDIGPIMSSVYMVPLNFVIFTSGIAMYSGESDPKKAVKTVVTHPCVISCLIGILIMVSGVTFPDFIVQPIQLIGRSNTVLSMMIVGFVIGEMKAFSIGNLKALMFSFERLILIPFMMFIILRLLPLGRTAVGASVLLTAMPCAAINGVLAAKYERKPDFSAQLIMTSTLLSLPTLLIWCLILEKFL